MKAKKKLKRYAKVKDNFGSGDKGKEKFIGKTGQVMQVSHDYSCFSQVLLKFEDGSAEWFSNIALEEVAKDGSRKLQVIEEVVESVVKEYEYIARTEKPLTSLSEGWVSIKQKVDELWDKIKQSDLNEACMKAESISALALQFVMDMRNKEKDEEE